jgi:hypothetical protein
MSSQSMEKSSSDAQTVKNVDSKEEISTNDAKPGSSSLSYKFKAGLFLSSIAGIGFLAGFGGSLAATKKKGFNHRISKRVYRFVNNNSFIFFYF